MSSRSGPIVMDRLKKRADFLRAARGVRKVMPGLTIEVCPTPEAWVKPDHLRLGFTATRKIGTAVDRNRARRRLKAAAALTLPLYALAGNDYVLVARHGTAGRPFDGLLADLATALQAAHSRLGSEKSGDSH